MFVYRKQCLAVGLGMMGHSPQVLFSTYAHVIAELRGAAPLSAEEQIRAARSSVRGEDA
jgi:hypothetical protein